MRIIFDSFELDTIKEQLRNTDISVDKFIKDYYLAIMNRNLFQDVGDIIRENNLEKE